MSSQLMKLEHAFIQTAEYFCFNPDKYSMEDMFGDVNSFLSQLNKACRDNVREVETKARLERIKLTQENTFKRKVNQLQR